MILFIWLLLWQAASQLVGNALLLVSPLRTAETFLRLTGQQEFWYSISLSLLRSMSAFVLALLVGSLLAAVGWRFALVHEFLSVPLNIMKATPVVSFIILVLLWVPGRFVSLVCAFVMVLPIVYGNIYQGFRGIDKKLLEVGQVFKLSRCRQILQIYIPSLKPHLLAVCTVGIGLCWKSAVAAEVIGLPRHTIGMHLYNAKVYLETPELFAWTFTVVVLSVCIEKLVLKVLGKILR